MFNKEFLSIFFSLIALFVFSCIYQARVQYQSAVNELSFRAKMVADFSYSYIVQDNNLDLFKSLGRVAQHYAPSYLLIVSNDGRIVFSYPRINLLEQSLPEDWSLPQKGGLMTRMIQGESVLEASVPIQSTFAGASEKFGIALLGVNRNDILVPILVNLSAFGVIGLFSIMSLSLVIYLVSRNYQKAFDYFKTQIGLMSNGETQPILVHPSDPLAWKSLIQNLNQILLQFNETKEKLIESQKQAATAQIASQVAHDIRSPLIALNLVIQDLSELSEKKRTMITSSVNRINDIAHTLLKKQTDLEKLSQPSKKRLLQPLVEALVSEKRTRYKMNPGVLISLHCDPLSYTQFVEVDASQLVRALSNLLDNAIESLSEKGEVQVKLQLSGENQVKLQILDTGKGIPSEILKNIGTRGFTYMKPGGSGLGYYQAKEFVSSNGGTLKISSEVAQGTQVEVQLPSCPAPKWFCGEILIYPDITLVIVDDDPSVYPVWEKRFANLSMKGKSFNIQYFGSPDYFSDWIQSQSEKNKILCLIDYEFSSHQITGLELITQLSLQKKSVLVTSHADEDDLQKRCTQLGVRILPKSMMNWITVSIQNKS